MLKKLSKILLLVLLIFVVSSSSLICLADEDHEHSTDTVGTTETTTTGNETASTETKTHIGDLYLFDNDIIMDKYVDGNVFLFGNNIEITGRVNGNLFVFGNNVKFNESVVRYSIFVCANSVYYNGGCGTEYDYGNLYVAASNFESTYNSYVTGDLKSVASSTILKSAVYRDVDLICNDINFGEGEDIPMINGNIRYTAKNEVNMPEGVMAGNGSITYTSLWEANYSNFSVVETLIAFATCIVTTLAIYILLNKLTPKFAGKASSQKFSVLGLLKAFGIGIATILVISIFFILLLLTSVGIKLSLLLALLFAILCLISVPVLAISITTTLKPILKIEKNTMFYLVLSLVSVVLYGITFIPFVGTLLGFIISVTSIGLIVNIFLPHKELSDEEKAALEIIKKQNKEDKEKRKQEKREIKAAKKQEKLEAKEAKKNNKEI